MERQKAEGRRQKCSAPCSPSPPWKVRRQKAESRSAPLLVHLLLRRFFIISAFCLLTSAFSKVMSAVRKVEALIAERKIGDLAAAQRERETHPVVERRVGDLVAREAPGFVGEGDVADLATPPFGERGDDCIRPQRAGVDAQRRGRQG